MRDPQIDRRYGKLCIRNKVSAENSAHKGEERHQTDRNGDPKQDSILSVKRIHRVGTSSDQPKSPTNSIFILTLFEGGRGRRLTFNEFQEEGGRFYEGGNSCHDLFSPCFGEGRLIQYSPEAL